MHCVRSLPVNGAVNRRLAAVDLIPKIGRTRYAVRGTQMDRFEMISEYIRRQSGHRRTVKQIRNFTSNLKYGQDEGSEST